MSHELDKLEALASKSGDGEATIDTSLAEYFRTGYSNGDPALLSTLIAQVPQALHGYFEYKCAQAVVDIAHARFAEARSTLTGLLESGCRNPRAFHRLAAVLLATDDGPGAQAVYLKALELAPKSDDLQREFAGVVRVLQSDAVLKAVAAPKHRCAIACCLKNEADDIVEWMHFHKTVGFDHFYIYDNESSDETIELIQSFPWPEMVSLHIVRGDYGQLRAYQHAIDTYRNQAEWIAFIDGDEFLFPTTEKDINDVLANFDDAASVVVHWLNFGSNGLQQKPTDLCIESFTRRAPDEFPDHYVVKSIVRPRRIVSYLHPHQSLVLGPQFQEDRSVVMPTNGRCPTYKHAALRINHYYTKSEEQLLKKRNRGRPLKADDPSRIRDIEFFRLRDRNDLEDLTIQRFVPQTKRSMGIS